MLDSKEKELEVYLVGGAVRDQLLGRPVKDRDWVVVGAMPDELIAKGYKPVGRDFPVFLHPGTKEEYALARKERKTGPGYRGFQVDYSPDVTLREDLLRRDLTMNAIAQDRSGEYIDYFGGRSDLEQGVLRHVSEAFVEDPVRILRVARFRSRYGFTVAAETQTLMQNMVESGEVDALVAERVWQELSGALSEPQPSLFIETLRDCGALRRIFPEIDALFGVPQKPEYHPEIDTGVHTLMALRRSAALSDDPQVRFAVLVHDLGKALTPAEELPGHREHEARGVEPIEALCERLRIPRDYRRLALAVCVNHLKMHTLPQLKPATVVKLLESVNAFRNRRHLANFIIACQADAQGRLGREEQPYPQGALLLDCFDAVSALDLRAVTEDETDGKRIGERVFGLQCDAVAGVMTDWSKKHREQDSG